ncbi:Endonuclease/exonuclease/phosphatase [Aspergillus cavernicola]|uniref:Endonuclease/exonuclease/phosphatase n=1 Tax=Aspergillus cavernicola TaxID=176166 RepID=A0ABR4IDD1_9EURO
MAPSLQPDTPNTQTFYCFDPTTDPPQWRPASSCTAHDTTDRLHLISWNIDFHAPAPRERMSAALQHLNKRLSDHGQQNDSPTVIFFQEMVESDLGLIQQAPWIRDRFYITDLFRTHWRASYGTLTLVDRRLHIQRVFRVPYGLSRMQRDGLFVDINMQNPHATGGNPVIRLCNTHLESLASGISSRTVQLKLASEFMHGTGRYSTSGLPTPHAAILAGDLNAFAPEDAIAPNECGLNDAFLALGGTEETEEAYTWGKQNPVGMDGKFPDARMDKVLFCGSVEVLAFAKIGEGLKARVDCSMDDDTSDDEAEDAYDDVWVTDHLGLDAEFRILDL